HLLRLVLSNRIFTAQVTCEATGSIVAMATSSEAEFMKQYKARVYRFPRRNFFWDSKVSSSIGDKISHRLKEIGVSEVRIDAEEELSRPIHYRKLIGPFFDSVERGGIAVDGVEKL
ncbi:hypothetical protein M569_01748, partial [Genlisea aurea]